MRVGYEMPSELEESPWSSSLDILSTDESDDEPRVVKHQIPSRLHFLMPLSCSDYTGKLIYKDPKNLFLKGAMCNFYRCTLEDPKDTGNSRTVVVKRRQMLDFHEVELPVSPSKLGRSDCFDYNAAVIVML